MIKTLVFPAGRAIQFTSGEYSDFGNRAAVVTIKECDLRALADEFKATLTNGNSWEHLSGFVPWLITNGHVFPADIQEVHLGSDELDFL